MDTICVYVKPKGERCRVRKMADSDYCYWHNPDIAAKRAEARKRGGQNRRVAKKSSDDNYSIQSTADILKALEDALNDVAGTENSHARSRTIGYLCQIAFKGLEIGELANRLEALEKKVFSKKKGGI